MPTDNRPKAYCINHPDRLEKSRGLCQNCYAKIIKRIRSGKLNEAQAMRRGLILKRRRTGRKRSIKPFPKLSRI